MANEVKTWKSRKAMALATQYSTAFYACSVAKTNVLPNETVLIYGAGAAAQQLYSTLEIKNAKIYATAGSSNKLEYCKQQGANVVINYTKDDFSEVIKEPIDVAFDSLGAANFRKVTSY